MEVNKALIESLENYTRQCVALGSSGSDCPQNLSYLAAKYALDKIANREIDIFNMRLCGHWPFGVYLLAIASFQPWRLHQIDWPKSLAAHDKNPGTSALILRKSVTDECKRLFENAQQLALDRLSKITDASEFLSVNLPPDFELGLKMAYASIVAMSGANLPSEVGFIFRDCSIVSDGYAKANELKLRVKAGGIKQDWIGDLLKKFFDTAQTKGINLSFMSLVNFLKAQDGAVFRSSDAEYPNIAIVTTNEKTVLKLSMNRKTSTLLGRRAMSDRAAQFSKKLPSKNK